MRSLSSWSARLALRLVARGSVVGGLTLALWLSLALPGIQTSAAQAAAGETVTLTFTVTIQAGSAPADVAFWVCADASAADANCTQMSGPTTGPFTLALAATTNTTYQHLLIEWTHGSQTGAKGPAPLPPVHTVCPYPPLTVNGPQSFTCQVDFSAAALTPTPGNPGITPTDAPPNSYPTPVANDTGTLITGLQIIIGVGLVLLLILVSVLIWQRLSGSRP